VTRSASRCSSSACANWRDVPSSSRSRASVIEPSAAIRAAARGAPTPGAPASRRAAPPVAGVAGHGDPAASPPPHPRPRRRRRSPLPRSRSRSACARPATSRQRRPSSAPTSPSCRPCVRPGGRSASAARATRTPTRSAPCARGLRPSAARVGLEDDAPAERVGRRDGAHDDAIAGAWSGPGPVPRPVFKVTTNGSSRDAKGRFERLKALRCRQADARGRAPSFTACTEGSAAR
jgi:hypothetical protein